MAFRKRERARCRQPQAWLMPGGSECKGANGLLRDGGVAQRGTCGRRDPPPRDQGVAQPPASPSLNPPVKTEASRFSVTMADTGPAGTHRLEEEQG